MGNGKWKRMLREVRGKGKEQIEEAPSDPPLAQPLKEPQSSRMAQPLANASSPPPYTNMPTVPILHGTSQGGTITNNLQQPPSPPTLNVTVIGVDDQEDNWEQYGCTKLIDSRQTIIKINHQTKSIPKSYSVDVQAWKEVIKSSSPDLVLFIYSPHSARSFEFLQEVASSFSAPNQQSVGESSHLDKTKTMIMSVRRELCTNWPRYVEDEQGKLLAKSLGIDFHCVIKEKYGFSPVKRPIGFGQYTRDLVAKSPELFRAVLGEVVKEAWVTVDVRREQELRRNLMELDNFEVGKEVASLEPSKDVEATLTEEESPGRTLISA